ncbi:MAG: hypothetical protein EOR92_31685 [Mesorhizobium sp.]|nr:MAG: hypothetical protein EOR02_00275 [Mesorhizobium sp.]RWQ12978.1 MAG: hypothetical protein EOR92_31685 [Mesorhizobium sp.]
MPAARRSDPCRTRFSPLRAAPYCPTALLPYCPTALLPFPSYTFNNRYSRSHGLITSMKVSNSARLIAA